MEIQIPRYHLHQIVPAVIFYFNCVLVSLHAGQCHKFSIINVWYKFQWSEYHSGSWRATGDEAGDKMEQWVAAKVNIEKTESDQTADEWRNWEQEIVWICYVCEFFFTRGHLMSDAFYLMTEYKRQRNITIQK